MDKEIKETKEEDNKERKITMFSGKNDVKYTPPQTMQQPYTRKPLEGVALLIHEKCNDIKGMLIEKNEQYGDSALNPIRIFSTSNTDEQLRVRIDDKLSRLSRGNDSLESDDDIINDLIGYLVLLSIHKDTHPISGEVVE